MSVEGGNRRIDRIRDPAYVADLGSLDLAEVRRRRDECMAERENLSLLRRLVQGRAEILKAELERRETHEAAGPLTERLAEILTSDENRTPSRGEAVRLGVPDDEVALARRRVERLVADAGLSDPSALSDERLSEAVDVLLAEERTVSEDRSSVISVLDTLQDELKRRYKEDPSTVLT